MKKIMFFSAIVCFIIMGFSPQDIVASKDAITLLKDTKEEGNVDVFFNQVLKTDIKANGAESFTVILENGIGFFSLESLKELLCVNKEAHKKVMQYFREKVKMILIGTPSDDELDFFKNLKKKGAFFHFNIPNTYSIQKACQFLVDGHFDSDKFLQLESFYFGDNYPQEEIEQGEKPYSSNLSLDLLSDMVVSEKVFPCCNAKRVVLNGMTLTVPFMKLFLKNFPKIEEIDLIDCYVDKLEHFISLAYGENFSQVPDITFPNIKKISVRGVHYRYQEDSCTSHFSFASLKRIVSFFPNLSELILDNVLLTGKKEEFKEFLLYIKQLVSSNFKHLRLSVIAPTSLARDIVDEQGDILVEILNDIDSVKNEFKKHELKYQRFDLDTDALDSYDDDMEGLLTLLFISFNKK